jgi:2-haloacid dehalogenase
MKSDTKLPKAFVFDAYGTLFDVRSVITAIEQKFPGMGLAVSSQWRAKQLEYTWLRSSMGRYEDFWNVTESALIFTCNDMKLPCDAATRAQLMESYLHLDLFPEVREALKSLSGRPLVILSNGTLEMLQAVVESAGLERRFAHVISVDEVKTYKPNAAPYQLALRKLGVDRKDIGFVSSNFWDAAGAKAFGFATYWVNRSGATADELGVTPDATLAALTELVEFLKA